MARTTNWAALALLALSLSGCRMFSPSADPATLVERQPEIQPETVAIEYRTHGGKIKRVEVPLEPLMTVQDAVDQHKIGKHFRRAKIDVSRPIPQSHEPLKMPIAWNNGKKRVSHATNYALHPRDTIVVTEDVSTVVDDMLGAMMLGGKSPKR